MSGKKERELLIEKQGGLSPVTGKALEGRLETHHVKELVEGGKNELNNKQAIPIEEHLAVHFVRSREVNREGIDQRRELDTVMGRLDELTNMESKKMSEVIYQKTGIRVRFL